MALDPLLRSDPATVGPYRLVGRIGQGGMGTVYLAVGPQDRAVALKVLRDGPSDADARRRFGRELAVLRRVRGPHLVEVLDGDAGASTPWIVTRFVPGRRVDEVVAEDGPLDEPALLRVGLGVGLGLQALHAAGVVHRDLTPGNVLLLDGEPHVIDLGLALMSEVTMLTRTGLLLGTAGYLAPEQVLGTGCGPAADVFAWGATLALAGTGRPPFGLGRSDAVLYRVVHAEPDLSGLPDPLAPLVAAALAKDPADRCSLEEVVAELRRLSARELVAVSTGPHALLTSSDALPVVARHSVEPATEVLREAAPRTESLRPADPAAEVLRGPGSATTVRRPADPATDVLRGPDPVTTMRRPADPATDVLRGPDSETMVLRPADPATEVLRPADRATEVLRPAERAVPPRPATEVLRPGSTAPVSPSPWAAPPDRAASASAAPPIWLPVQPDGRGHPLGARSQDDVWRTPPPHAASPGTSEPAGVPSGAADPRLARRARLAVLLPATALLGALSLSAPAAVALAVAVGLVLLETGGRVAGEHRARAERRGSRLRDPALDLLGLPGRLLGSVTGLLLALPVVVLVMAVPAYVLVLAVDGTRGPAVAAAASTVVGGGLVLRRRRFARARSLLRQVGAGKTDLRRALAVGGLLLAAAALVAGGALSSGPDWAPVTDRAPVCVPVLPCD